VWNVELCTSFCVIIICNFIKFETGSSHSRVAEDLVIQDVMLYFFVCFVDLHLDYLQFIQSLYQMFQAC
jgi:hypothetical protein